MKLRARFHALPGLLIRKPSLLNSQFAVPVLLLVLAFIFMLPGLPPFGVAAPMGQLLVYPPWQASYTDPVPLLRGGDIPPPTNTLAPLDTG